jgi:outer membrane protein assembly factor BamB
MNITPLRPAFSPSAAGPPIEPGGTIYAGCWNGTLMAFDPDGGEKWKCKVDGTLATTPRIARDGTIVVRGMNRRVWAFDPDGAVIWSPAMPDKSMGASILPTPTVAPDGTVYVGNNDNTLTALHFRTLNERLEEAREAPPEVKEKVEVQDEWIIIGGMKLPVNKQQFT